MAWTNVPPATGTDIQLYDWVNQFWQATQERAWATGAATWPQSSHIWTSGTITALTDNGDGTYTLTDAGATNTVNRFFGYTTAPPQTAPVYYDLIFDNEFDETLCFHTQILGNTATTFKITDIFPDHLTEGWLPNVSSLVGQKYYVIKRGGLWWHERWLVWPNDQESWVGLNLQAGALQPVDSLTSSGTTATAVIKNHASGFPANGHGFLDLDSVTIAGAVSTHGYYNGTFTITVVDDNTFTYTIGGTDSSPATGSITAYELHTGAYDALDTGVLAGAAFPLNSDGTGGFSGGSQTYELLAYDEEGGSVGSSADKLHRLSIIGNDTHNLYFTRDTFYLAGQYAVVPSGNRYRNYKKFIERNCSDVVVDCNPFSGPPFRWYHGPWDHYYTHGPESSVGGPSNTVSPTLDITLIDVSGAYTKNIYDEDVWTEFNDIYNPPDHNYTPDLYRTIRGIQDALESICPDYVPPHSYNGYNAVPTFVPATWLSYAGVNSILSNTTTADGSGGMNIDPVTLPTVGGITAQVPIQVYYCVQNVDLSPSNSGIAILDTLSHLTWVSGPSGPLRIGDESKGIVMSLGWTRKYPNEFLYMYQKQCFIPDYNASLPGGGGFQDPPTTAFPGRLYTRLASSKYKETTDLSLAPNFDANTEVGLVCDNVGYRNFVNGDFARYSGDNFNDPTVHNIDSGGNGVSVGDSVTPYQYLDRLYEGILSKTEQAARNSLMSGTVTGTGVGDGSWHDNNSSITDTSKNWWPGGVLITETGSASSGSSTDLSDTSKSTNGFWLSMGGTRWSNQILEITKSGTTYRRPVNIQSGTNLSWLQALPVSASSSTYKIRTPKYEMNTWAGRTLKLTLPDGTALSTRIDQSDDNTLYFAPLGVVIPIGTTYLIQENTPGGVWEWSSAQQKWLIPTGNDSRTGNPWLTDQTANLATVNTRYGKVMKGDYITPTSPFWTELYNAIQALVWLKQIPNWDANGENNERQGIDLGAAVFNDAQTTAKANYLASVMSINNAPPFALSYTDTKTLSGEVCYSYAVARRYAYATVSSLDVRQAASIDYYILPGIPTAQDGSAGTLASSGYPNKEVFDAMGDNVGTVPGYFHLVTSSGPATTSTQSSPKISSLSMPTDIGPAPGPIPDGTNLWYQGWMTYDAIGIIKKNVVGGFVYQ